MYLIVMTHSEVHIQRVHFAPEAPVLIDLVLPNSRNEYGNLECEKGLLSNSILLLHKEFSCWYGFFFENLIHLDVQFCDIKTYFVTI